ncbi:MAG: sensor histidine kinase, partial [Romboutsia sp.]
KKIKTLLIINLIVVGIMCGFWFFRLIILPIYTIVLYIIIKKKYLSVNRDYSKLLDLTKAIANGKLDTRTDEDLGTFNVMKNEIENIQRGFKKAVDEEVKSQKMKTELISNVSHDLKTPLTSIITYVDLLKDENLSEEKRIMYIDTLERKSERLRVLIEDLFEVSKANSGDVSLNIMDVDVVSLMKQTLLEVDDKMKASNLKIKNNFPDEKVILKLDSQRMFRVFENLLINISKYAMDSSRVYIDIINEKECVTISFKNMTAEEIDFNVDELAERFVRGDKARNTDGSGLGLAIAKSFVELQGGRFEVSTDGDLFKVVIKFNK